MLFVTRGLATTGLKADIARRIRMHHARAARLYTTGAAGEFE